MTAPETTDPVLVALDNLLKVLGESVSRGRIASERAEAIRRMREMGQPYRDIVPQERRPLIVEVLTHTLNELAEASSRFRRSEARALYSEGLTMAQVANLFGVSRQRVAALLGSVTEENGSGATLEGHKAL